MEALLKSNSLLQQENRNLKARHQEFIESLQNIIETYKTIEYECEGFDQNDQQDGIFTNYDERDPLVGCGESNYDVFGGTDQPNEETVTVPPTEIVYENGEEDDDGVSEESDRGMDSDFVLDKVRSMAGISITSLTVRKPSNLIGHTIDDSADDEFSCNQCPFVGHSSQSLKYHKTKQHPEISLYECAMCSFTSSQMTVYKRHILNVHKMSARKCDSCMFVAHSTESMAEHKLSCSSLAKKLLGERDWTKTIECEQCNYVGNSKSALSYHIQVNHSSDEFPCDVCDYVGQHTTTFRHHMRKQHGRVYTKEEAEERKRSAASSRPSGPDGHIESSKEPELKRPTPSAAISQTQVNQQRPTFSQERPVPQLQRSAALQQALQSQRLATTSKIGPLHRPAAPLQQRPQNSTLPRLIIPKERITLSSKSRTALMKLKKKKKKKKLKRPFRAPACDMCDYVGNSTTALKYHIQSNHSGLGFPCPLCEYVGKHSVLLKNHLKKHHHKVVKDGDEWLTGQPLIQCDKCEYLAKSDEYLASHKEKEHSGIEYPCSVCEFVARDRLGIKLHLTSQHNLVVSDEMMISRPTSNSAVISTAEGGILAAHQIKIECEPPPADSASADTAAPEPTSAANEEDEDDESGGDDDGAMTEGRQVIKEENPEDAADEDMDVEENYDQDDDEEDSHGDCAEEVHGDREQQTS